MLRLGLNALNAIDRGEKPIQSVKIYFQIPETYTQDDYLEGVDDISQSLSREGRYEIGNTRITLLNRQFYFSRKFAKELPNNRLCEVIMTIGGESIIVFRGVVGTGWTLTDSLLVLNVNV